MAKKEKKYELCHYCEEYEYVTIDHKKPLANGGLDIETNKVLACGACNQLKADIPYNEFITIHRDILKRYKGLWKKNVRNRALIKKLKA